MNQPNFEQARQYARHRLETQLAPHLFYHSLSHTYDYVLPAAIRLAKVNGLSLEEQKLLEIAVLYHDMGFIIQCEGHESIGARIAAQTLPHFGFSEAQIETIVGIIMATRLPQSPRNLLEEIMADADLYVLGSDNFFATSYNLRLELEARGQVATDEEWYRGQLQFLQNHSYFTKAANLLRGPGKLRNLAKIKKRCALLPSEKNGTA